MWELDCEESWALKNWCFWTVVLAKTLESPVDCKEIQPVHSKGDQSWVFIGRTDFEAETLILWPPDVKSWLIWKDPHAGKDWEQEEKGTTEDEMVGWHHWLNGHGFGWTPEVGDGQGGLVCCGSWGHKESDTTEQLNWSELFILPKSSLTSLNPSRSYVCLILCRENRCSRVTSHCLVAVCTHSGASPPVPAVCSCGLCRKCLRLLSHCCLCFLLPSLHILSRFAFFFSLSCVLNLMWPK